MIYRAAVAALVLLLLVLQYRLWIADGGVAHTHRLHQQLDDMRAENQAMQMRNDALDAEVRDLNDGTAAIEARARTTLGMVKKGETFYLVVNP
ncbi:cell division protein FtsB [Sinimarinibacterium sp. NLF-5-8]|uniref:cell division protein FtsB n=1 Tax=Sinimarinibacterium sp. NLF-5-8 TaxID=2698684 RepID=UPI00137BDD12|nr:cell division protein FtsB [Sinimarinibacterium sp. NLF-5-8]QHS09382.1 cell division protein FtsB [Sinimarinibacterium sp. NLF-5-8]